MFKKNIEIENYFEDGLQIKVKQTRIGKIVSLRPNDHNRVIDISVKDSSIEYSIIDMNKGSMKFSIPVGVHQKILDEYLRG
ncbi:hypothetical protein LC087_17800 [Bacillus carboniphilus]|uniref:Uncharacterized protein n=1 Tax=Bacillus carboniphilus TaxID=86663 RepID=A0ABY9JSZ2_9BACI|nr:hypothetical protein [Bacillus carboniphilus]WLR42520.1 hypothetical protein LC087_17800 [Bacillus carboniphilus]